MDLKQIIDIADGAYPDGLVGQHFDEGEFSTAIGDGLAYFIQSEIRETYDSDNDAHDKLQEAIRVMSVARDEIQFVITALETALETCIEAGQP